MILDNTESNPRNTFKQWHATRLYPALSVHPSVSHILFFFHVFFCLVCSYPNALGSSRTAPAHQHATGVTMYLALYYLEKKYFAYLLYLFIIYLLTNEMNTTQLQIIWYFNKLFFRQRQLAFFLGSCFRASCGTLKQWRSRFFAG